ncbi:MAG: hypothetical protein RJA17_1119 [Pseudomonadota bacterium]
MLEPKKNPLIDEPLIATSAKTFERVRLIYTVLISLSVIALVAWLWLLSSFGENIYDETWWRQAISKLASQQVESSISSEQSSQLNDRVKEVTSENADIQSKLQNLERLIQATQTDVWTRKFVAWRAPGSDTIQYEVLISNPYPKKKPDPGSKIKIQVRGLDRLDPFLPEVGIQESVQRFKLSQHNISAPEIAEAVKGRLTSSISRYAVLMVLPNEDPMQTEVVIIPITERSN